MKRFLIVASIILAIVAVAVIAYKTGVRHAMVDSEIWVEAAEENDSYLIHIVLDGDEYMHVG